MKLLQGFRVLLIGSFFVFTTPSFAQTPPANRPAVAAPQPAIVFQGGPRVLQLNQDPFSNLINSAASIDMESPVTVRAEFDPPVIAAGGRSTYRIVLTALNESVKLPESLPTPPELQLQAGGRGQTYQPTGLQKLQPQTTIIYRATASSTGVFTMPAFNLTAYSKPVQVPEARLTVISSGAAGAREAQRLLVALHRCD